MWKSTPSGSASSSASASNPPTITRIIITDDEKNNPETAILKVFSGILQDAGILKEFLAGVDLDLGTVQNLEDLAVAILHCIVNGPVGVNRETKFPLLGDRMTSIQEIIGYKVSNKNWKKTCSKFATNVKSSWRDYKDYAPWLITHEDLWPLSDEMPSAGLRTAEAQKAEQLRRQQIVHPTATPAHSPAPTSTTNTKQPRH